MPENSPPITVEWLKDVLSHESWIREVVSIEIDENFGKWSLLGDIIRVELNYTEKQVGPKSVIVKYQRAVSNKEREAQIYRLLTKESVKCIPKIFCEFGSGNLIMEDLTPRRPGSRLGEISLSTARNITRLLADINGRFYKNLNIPQNDPQHFVNVIRYNMEHSWDSFHSQFETELGETVKEFEWMRDNSEIVSAQHNSKPATLTHGDAHLENMLFTTPHDEAPIIIDWQLAAKRVIPFDIANFLIKRLTIEQRREYGEFLLKEYYGFLPRKLQDDYSFERMMLDSRACITRSMLSVITISGKMFESNPHQTKIAEIMTKRVVAAIKDLKPVEALQELQNIYDK